MFSSSLIKEYVFSKLNKYKEKEKKKKKKDILLSQGPIFEQYDYLL